MTNPHPPLAHSPGAPLARSPGTSGEGRGEGSSQGPRRASLLARAEIRRAARRWPRNPYVQAAVMYPRRWVFRLIAVWMIWPFLVTAAVVCARWTSQIDDREVVRRTMTEYQVRLIATSPETMATFGALLAVFVLPGAVAIAAHVRDRLTDWRGSVIPSYRTPQVVVGALLTAVVVAGVAGTTYAAQPFSFAGLLAACAWIAAIGGACAALPPKGVAVVGIGSVAAASLREVRGWIAYAVFGFDETRAAFMLVTGLVALAGVWTWLALDRRERTPARQEDLMLAERLVRWRKRPGEDVTTMSLARRVRLFRLPSSTGLMPVACAAGLLLLIGVLEFTGVERREHALGVAAPLAGLSVMFPVAAVATQWARRLPGLGYEMSRPVARPRFLRDAGMAMAADWFLWWFWLTLAGTIGVVATIFWLRASRDVRFGSDPLAIFASAVAASAAAQVALYGLIVWVMRFQAAWAVYLTAFMGALLCWIPLAMVVDARRQWATPHLGVFAAAIALLGLLLTADAYRRWLRVDLR